MIYVYEVFQMMHTVKFKNYSTRENKWKAPYFSIILLPNFELIHF